MKILNNCLREVSYNFQNTRCRHRVYIIIIISFHIIKKGVNSMSYTYIIYMAVIIDTDLPGTL